MPTGICNGWKEFKLSGQTYNIADIELRDRRVIYRGRDSVDNSTLMFKVFARNTTDDVFTQEIGTATAFFSFYNFGLLVNLTNSDGQIVNFSFSGGGYWYPSSGGYWKGSLLGGVMGIDNCRMTWDDKVVTHRHQRIVRGNAFAARISQSNCKRV